MHRRSRAYPLLLAVALVVHVQAASAADSLALKAPALLKAARQQAGAPGISVAVVDHDRLVWSGADGVADVEQDVPATAATVYRIASISKTMAATALMQLVEAGRVSLDDPVRKHLPYFPDKGGMTITVRHLLTHTSGIRHYKTGEMDNMRHYDSVSEAAAIFEDDPLLFTPGTKYSYTTYGYNLVAGIIEAASGLTYEAYLREHVWGPAGMTATRLEYPQQIVKGRARQYVKAGGQVLNAPYADLSVKWAGGGVISTAEDLARFHIALDTGRLLKPETMRAMYEPAKLPDGSSTGYGLGWMIAPDDKGGRWIVHSGGATGGSTLLVRKPETGLAVVILCNVQDAGNLRKLALDLAALAGAGGTE